MKKFGIVLAAIALLSLTATAVTRIPLYMLLTTQSTSGGVVVALPSGTVTFAQMGPGVTLNTATQPPTLNASHTVANSVVASTADQTWPTPSSTCSSLLVEWNGVVLNNGIDYTVATGGGSITIASAAGTVEIGDVIQMQCLP